MQKVQSKRKQTRRPKDGLSEFERYKKRILIRRKANMILGIFIITLAVAALVAGFGMFSDSEFGMDFRAQFSTGSKFPYPLGGAVVRQMAPIGWNAAVLDDGDLFVLDNKGNQKLHYTHGYSKPVLKAGQERMLLYDQGGTRYSVYSASRQVYEAQSDASIHAGDIAADGSIVLATSSAKSASEVLAYDALGNQICYWSSSSMVTSIALSPDGQRAAVSMVNAQSGGLVTSLCLLDLQNAKPSAPLFKLDLSDEFGCYVSFKNNGICLITDQAAHSVTMGGEVRESYTYGGQQVLQFADAPLGETVIVLGNQRYMRSSDVVMLDDRCRVLGSFQTEESIDSLHANQNGFYCLAQGIVTHYDYKGKALSRTPAAGAVICLPIGQDLYAATYDNLTKLTIR